MEKPITASDAAIAQEFSEALAERDRPPHSVAQNSVMYWRRGKFEANYLMLEWICEKSSRPQAREWAQAFLTWLDDNAVQASAS